MSASPSLATRLVELVVEDSDARLFHTPKDDGYISVRIDGHVEHYQIGSGAMKKWLSRLSYTMLNTSPPAQVLADAMNSLNGMAVHDGPVEDVYVRIGQHGPHVYIDLGDPHWRAIEVGPSGWSIVSDPPIRFRRSRGALGLPEPTKGGSANDLRRLIHIDNDADFHLLVAWLLGAFSPRGPYPLLALTGEQGSGKSTTARKLRRLIDPHVSELRAAPKREEDVMIAASGSHVLAFDNLSYIDPAWSDLLCMLSTGGAMTKRQLFTDADEHSIEAIRPVMLTSITPVVQRGDLLDRAILIDLPVMPETSRRAESTLWAEFDELAPGIFGALLDGVASALARATDPAPERLPRLADWATWTYRCEPGINWTPGTMLDAYRTNRSEAIAEVVAGDPVALAVKGLSRPWTGTCDALLKLLTPTTRPAKGWPENPRGMSAALRRLAPMLRQVGIEVTFSKDRHGHNRDRLLSIEDTAGPPETPSASSASSAGPYSLGKSADGSADGLSGGPQSSARPSADSGPYSLGLTGADGADGVSGVCSEVEEVGDAFTL